MVMRLLQRLPAPVAFVVVMVAMVPVMVVIGAAQLISGVLHRPPAGTPRWSQGALRQFQAEHRNGYLPGATEPAGGWVHGDDTTPDDDCGMAIIGTRGIRLCQAHGPSAHQLSQRWMTYRGFAGLPKDQVELECSCGVACSSDRATSLMMMGSSMSFGPALFLCDAHAGWFQGNRLMGGGAGGWLASTDATGLWH